MIDLQSDSDVFQIYYFRITTPCHLLHHLFIRKDNEMRRHSLLARCGGSNCRMLTLKHSWSDSEKVLKIHLDFVLSSLQNVTSHTYSWLLSTRNFPHPPLSLCFTRSFVATSVQQWDLWVRIGGAKGGGRGALSLICGSQASDPVSGSQLSSDT